MVKHQSIKLKVASFAAAGAILLAPAMPATNLFLAQAASNGSYVTLNSFSGHPGAALMVSGGSFAPNETITVVAVEGGSQIAQTTTKATASGTFSTTLQLPVRLAQGSAQITASGAISGLSSSNAYYVNPFTPSITTNAGDTTPFKDLYIAGSGFAPNEMVDFNLAGSTSSIKAGADGSFKDASVTTPNVPAASYTLVAAGRDSGASTVSYQYIDAFYASASPTSYYVMPLASLGFNGNGFAGGETVTVSEAVSGKQVSQFKAGADGSFKNGGAFNVPASYAGTSQKFVLTGSLSHATASVSVNVGQYYPNVSPTSYYVMPGQTNSFNGSGFVPGETVDVMSGTSVVTTAVADKYGNLTAAGTVTTTAAQAGTSQTYTLVGETSRGAGSVTFQVGAFNPQASPSAWFTLPGSVITFSGTGFAPSELVAVFSGTTNLGSFSTDAKGSFIALGGQTVDYSAANSSVNYKLVGTTSNASVSFAIAVGQLQTMLSPSNYYVLPYQQFDVTLTGFAPNETVTLDASARANTGATLGTTTTDKTGTAVFKNVSVGPTATGSYTLSAHGATSNANASATIGVGSYYPTVVADNYYARPGTTIGLSGSGFAPNEDVSIVAAGQTVAAKADKTGAFTASLALPFGGKTTLDIVSTGALSGASSTTSITLAPYMPNITPSTWYSQPGTVVTFGATGFAPNETVNVSLNGTAVGTETTDAKGNMTSTGNYALPFGKAAVFTFTGSKSGASSDINIGLAQFYAGVQLGSYYGNGGASNLVSGTGYAPNETVTITTGKTVLATAVTDAKGAFSKAVNMPYAAPGKVTITATGVKSGAAPTTAYTVAKVYTNVQMGSYAIKAGQKATFIGSGFLPNDRIYVSSPAGTYNFMADAQGNFNDSGYTIPANTPEGNLTFTISGINSYTVSEITVYVQDKNAQ